MRLVEDGFLSGLRRWFISVTVFVVIVALLIGGSYLVVVQFLPDGERQNVAQITLTVGLAVVFANVVVSVMQWLGVSPFELLPERTLEETLRKTDRNRFILSRSKDVTLLSAQAKVAKDQKQNGWMYLFAKSWANRQPGNADAFELLGKALVELGYLEDAIHAGQRLIELEPLNSEGYTIIGDAYFKQASWEQTRIWYEKASEVASPQMRQFVLGDLVKVYERLGLVDEGITVINELLPLFDDTFQRNYYGEKLQHFLDVQARRNPKK